MQIYLLLFIFRKFSRNFAKIHYSKMRTTIGALFDLDGVLIDSESTYTEFWAMTGLKYDLPSPTFAHDIKGCTLTNILNTYFPDPEVQSGLIKAIHDFENDMKYPIFPGVTDFIDELRANKVRTAIVTSSDNVKMGYLFEQHPNFRQLFDAVVTGSMVSRSKPDPEGYLTAARMIDADISNCFVFEDSFQGLDAGLNSGATVIALATTNPAAALQGKAHEIITGFTGFSYDKMISVAKNFSRP